MARVLFFVNVKAVLNTIMVYTGWKRPGAFKVTTKAGGAPTPAGGAAPAAVEAAPVKEEEVERDTGGPTVPVRLFLGFVYRPCVQSMCIRATVSRYDTQVLLGYSLRC